MKNQAMATSENANLLATCLHAGILLGSVVDLEDEGDMFIRNVGWLGTEYTALYPQRLVKLTKFRGLSPPANYTYRAAASCRLTKCQLLRMEGVGWSSRRVHRPEPLHFIPSSSLTVTTRLTGPRSRPTTSQKIW
jgi:hypothetical protein